MLGQLKEFSHGNPWCLWCHYQCAEELCFSLFPSLTHEGTVNDWTSWAPNSSCELKLLWNWTRPAARDLENEQICSDFWGILEVGGQLWKGQTWERAPMGWTSGIRSNMVRRPSTTRAIGLVALEASPGHVPCHPIHWMGPRKPQSSGTFLKFKQLTAHVLQHHTFNLSGISRHTATRSCSFCLDIQKAQANYWHP